MKIKNVKVYGLKESIIRSCYPMKVGEPENLYIGGEQSLNIELSLKYILATCTPSKIGLLIYLEQNFINLTPFSSLSSSEYKIPVSDPYSSLENKAIYFNSFLY